MKKLIISIILLMAFKSNQIFAEETQYKTGLKVIPLEEKSIELENELRQKFSSLGALPSHLDYSGSPYLPPVGNQKENSCVGWAIGYYLRTYQEGNDIGWDIKIQDNYYDNRVFSPSFIYNQINDGMDGGATLEDAGELLESIGSSTLSDFPYIPKDYKTQPDSYTLNRAKNHKIKKWYTLYTKRESNEDIIRKTKEYLNTGDLLAIGIYIGSNWKVPYINEEGISIIQKQTSAREGHAVIVVGYDDELETTDGVGAFKVVNSWGKDWGNDGFSYISYEAFTTSVLSAIVYTDILNTKAPGDKPDDSLYEDLYENEIKIAKSDKEWTIKFNKEVDEKTLENIYIFKVDKEDTYRVKIEPVLDEENPEKVILRHQELFNAGNYTIYIDDSVKSIVAGGKLSKKVKMNFKVE